MKYRLRVFIASLVIILAGASLGLLTWIYLTPIVRTIA